MQNETIRELFREYKELRELGVPHGIVMGNFRHLPEIIRTELARLIVIESLKKTVQIGNPSRLVRTTV